MVFRHQTFITEVVAVMVVVLASWSVYQSVSDMVEGIQLWQLSGMGML